MTRTQLITITVTAAAVVAMVGGGISYGARADGDQTAGGKAPAVTLEEAIATAKAKFPGQVLEAEFEDEDGKAVYDVEIATATGETREVVVDASSGQITESEAETEDEGHEQDKEDR